VEVKAGLRDYFSSFIISSQKGITKPNKLICKKHIVIRSLKDLG